MGTICLIVLDDSAAPRLQANLRALEKYCTLVAAELPQWPVRGGDVTYIGKESNAVEAIQQGLVHEMAEVRAQYLDPAESPWEHARPLLRGLPVKRLAQAGQCSERMVKYLRQGKRMPSPKLAARLLRECSRLKTDFHKKRRVKPRDLTGC